MKTIKYSKFRSILVIPVCNFTLPLTLPSFLLYLLPYLTIHLTLHYLTLRYLMSYLALLYLTLTLLFAPRTIESQSACFCRYLGWSRQALFHVRGRRSPRDVSTEPVLYPPFRGSGVVSRRRIFLTVVFVRRALTGIPSATLHLFFRHVRRCVLFLQCRAAARVSFWPGPFASVRATCNLIRSAPVPDSAVFRFRSVASACSGARILPPDFFSDP